MKHHSVTARAQLTAHFFSRNSYVFRVFFAFEMAVSSSASTHVWNRLTVFFITLDGTREAIAKGGAVRGGGGRGRRGGTIQNSQHILSVKKGGRQSASRGVRRQQGSNNRVYRIISLSIDNLVIHGVYLCSMGLSPPDNYTPDYSWRIIE